MRRFLSGLLITLAFSAVVLHGPQAAKADSLCYLSATYPSPVPTNSGAAILGLCPAGVLQVNATTTGAPTPIPYPTTSAGVLLVQPTNVPTIGVTVVNTPAVTCPTCPTPLAVQPVSLPTSFQTSFPTPIPFPTLGVNVLNTPSVNQGTSPWVVTTPPPFSGVVSGTVTANAGTGTFATRENQPKSGSILTSASATTCTNVQAVAGNGIEIVNSGPATTIFPQFYNDAGATCAAGTLFYGDGTTLIIGAGQIIKIDFPVAGIAYKLSGALTTNLSITGL